MAATLKAQWDALKQGDDTARLLFRVAGQFPEATAIPTNALGLFAGVSHTHKPGHPSPLRRALKRLHDVRLIEELREHRVRLHPLVREFAAGLIPPSETPGFRHACAGRVVQAFEEFATLEDAVRTAGVDGLQQTLLTALDFLAGGEAETAEALGACSEWFGGSPTAFRSGTPGGSRPTSPSRCCFGP